MTLAVVPQGKADGSTRGSRDEPLGAAATTTSHRSSLGHSDQFLCDFRMRGQCRHCPHSGVGAYSARAPLRTVEIYYLNATPQPGHKSRKFKTASPYLRFTQSEKAARRPPSDIAATLSGSDHKSLSDSDHKSRSYSMISTMRRLRGSTMTGRSLTIAYR